MTLVGIRIELVLVAVMGIACTKPGATAKPCERGAKLELRVVDNDSAFMKKLFAHVGSDRDGLPTDRVAIDAGIRADIDQWRTDILNEDKLPVDQRTETDYFVHSVDRAALERYLAGDERPPADREITFEHVNAGSRLYSEKQEHWRTYYVEKTPFLDTHAIADVRVESDRITGKPTMRFTLTREGQQAFLKGTTKSVGRKIATMIDGVILSAPIVNGPVKGGQFSVAMDSADSASALLAKLRCVK